MSLNRNPFTWWNGATFGTWFGLRGKTRIGEDSLGNVYWAGGKDPNGITRRWVIYNGPNDASRVPPEWFGWLHHQIDAAPDQVLPAPRSWEKAPEPNQTGTRAAYRPSGALEAGGQRARSTGDYEAWTPDA
ncbi:NADH:ubiquinone oxidoreductase subunit NDUFA12 [Sphingomonas psychrotolerans]|uniref:NADH:ubiquinone oxidoreductase subunit NDUFA12 n=1 Tax=Sphingomonas psychrotolerans TaxID=1327635 RepID=A0A2K8MHC3_9SPHN|nr:NADH:ubiquinone oxidoreductase subunit NDUFA12 [Sphingomonas psychrotolerans]ATY31936.1 NADH:ubiquinone oxidoreductase subunit NDUFA12 [Sphingomonas psychrotolerans]